MSVLRLVQHLEAVDSARRELAIAGGVPESTVRGSSTFESVVLDYGQGWSTLGGGAGGVDLYRSGWSGSAVLGNGACYNNALEISAQSAGHWIADRWFGGSVPEDLLYVEGVACSSVADWYPIEHAWLVDGVSGRVIDPTWGAREGGASYFGVVFSDTYRVLDFARFLVADGGYPFSIVTPGADQHPGWLPELVVSKFDLDIPELLAGRGVGGARG